MSFVFEFGDQIVSNAIAFVSLAISIAVAISNYLHSKDSATRAQAELVSAWMDPHEGSVVLSNSSSNPVYEVVVCIVDIKGDGPKDGREVKRDCDYRAVFPILPPGAEKRTMFAFYGEGSLESVELAFCDSSGKSWLRSSGGRLKRLKECPSAYYQLPMPLDYSEFDCR